MDDILARIVAAKRKRIAAVAPVVGTFKPRTGLFRKALHGPGLAVIAEYKRASPSKGDIRLDLEVEDVVKSYAAGGAAALSILTEEDFFKGRLDFVRRARAVCDLPILRKDFICEEIQVAETAGCGADAILLIAAVLGSKLARFADLARGAGLDVLVEVHDVAEMEAACAIPGAVIGINNRDLRTFTVDLAVTGNLLHLAGGRTVVSESGVNSPADAEALGRMGASAVLVGESLMRSADITAALRALKGTIRPVVKICGLTRAEDIAAAVGAGADMVGFVFAPSPRRVTVDRCRELALGVPAGVKRVGVFVDTPLAGVRKTIKTCGLSHAQLHGGEDPAFCAALGAAAIKAVRVRSAADTVCLAGYPSTAFLLDTFAPGVAGGTGRLFDHVLVVDAAVYGRIIVAGGLTPDTVADMIRQVRPWGVDVSSGVESSPGIKDHGKIRAFVRNAKEAL
ncbi:MAG: bifunctional indole-3-glycerol phosphate synthase/phosphoribosylanthranilate isomerase [Planctomycetota bacterium]